jgi:hypothetical protein
MPFQPTLTEAEPAPLPPEDPWSSVREQHPDHYILRRIDTKAKTQEWIAIPKTRANIEAGAGLWDGATMWTPAPPPPAAMWAEREKARTDAIAQWHADPSLHSKHRDCIAFVYCALADFDTATYEKNVRVMQWFEGIEQLYNARHWGKTAP